MSVHPVTPMGEADLRKHFAKQGLERIGLIDYRVYESCKGAASLDACLATKPDAVLFDVIRAEDLPVVGALLMRHAAKGAMLAVGPSSVAHALCAATDERVGDDGARLAAGTGAMRDGPVLALVGSLSPVTRAQVSAARGYARIDIDPARLIGDASYSKALHEKTRDLLRAQHVMLVTGEPSGSPGASAGGRGCDRLAVAGGHGGGAALPPDRRRRRYLKPRRLFTRHLGIVVSCADGAGRAALRHS